MPGTERRKNWYRKRLSNPKACARGSFRVKQIRSKGPKGNVQLVVCCPKGKWDAKREVCRVSTVAQSERWLASKQARAFGKKR